MHGARVLCPFHPLKILKQTNRSSRDPGGVVIVDPERTLPFASPEASPAPHGSRIPRPDTRESSMKSQQ